MGTWSPAPGTARIFCPGCDLFEIVLQLQHVFGKAVGAGGEIAAQGARRQRVRAGRAAQTQIDASGKKRCQRAELLGDDQRRVIRQHDAAGADANGFGAAGDVCDDDGRGGAGDARHVVVLGEPVTVVAPSLGVLREVERVAQGVGSGCALRNRREVEDGEGNRHWWHSFDDRENIQRYLQTYLQTKCPREGKPSRGHGEGRLKRTTFFGRSRSATCFARCQS